MEATPAPVQPVFSPFVERRERCSAVEVSAKNVDDIARYYADTSCEYHTRVERHDGKVKLLISWDLAPVGEEPPMRGELEVAEEEVLMRGFPPSKMDRFEFAALWEPDSDRRT